MATACSEGKTEEIFWQYKESRKQEERQITMKTKEQMRAYRAKTRNAGQSIAPDKALQEERAARQKLSAAYKALNYVENKEARDRVEKAQERVEKAQKSRTNNRSIPQQITDFVYQQVGVDLSKYDAKTTRRYGGGVIFDWNDMPRVDKQRVMQAVYADNSKWYIQDWSGYQKLIRPLRDTDVRF